MILAFILLPLTCGLMVAVGNWLREKQDGEADFSNETPTVPYPPETLEETLQRYREGRV